MPDRLFAFARKASDERESERVMSDSVHYAVEQLDKGAWEVINRSTMQAVGGVVFPSRSRARAALDALKNGASEDDIKDGLTKVSKASKTKTESKRTVKQSKTSTDAAKKRVHGSEQPTAFALKKRAKNFDAIIDRYGKLPQGMIDVFNPRNVEGFVGLYHTMSVVEFDVTQIATTYVLRVEETGELFECSDKREGRLHASKIESKKPAAKKTAAKKKSVSVTNSASPTESIDNNPPF